MTSVTVGLLQVRVDGAEPVAERRARVVDLAAAVSRGERPLPVVGGDAHLDLLILPELWTVGAFDADAMLANPETVDGPLVRALASVARDAEVWLHAGSLPEVLPDGRRRNTAVLIAPDGAIAATYPKVHLFGFDEGEAAVLTAGEGPVVVATPLGATGLATCYDLRFPELFRALVDAGADAFVLTSGWPERRIEHWRVLLRARAIEDQAWVVACNEVGTHAGVLLGGRSSVVDPWGEVVVEGPSDAECLVVASIDPARVADSRSTFPVLRDRRL